MSIARADNLENTKREERAEMGERTALAERVENTV